ncbi:MAG: TlpA family protein disulfide reductase [Thermoanaerobaculales bacterium]|nr:TlpA family protein disulfide reductase [Thermoanaerobaculales bacterium]
MEFPRLEEIWNTYKDEGLSVVAIQSDQDREKGLRLVEEKGITFHILHNEEDNDVVNGVYRSEGNPSTFIIDREGRVVSYHLGFQEGDEVELEREITDLLASPEGCR